MSAAGSLGARWAGSLAPVAVGLAGVGGCAVVWLVDPGQPGRYPSCPFLALTGLQCPGCGTLRALHALTRGRPFEALGLNAMSLAVLALTAWAWLAWLLASTGRRSRPLDPPSWAAPVAIMVVVGFGVLRNLPVAPFAALAP